MITQFDEFVDNVMNSAMPFFERSSFERHQVTRKSLQMLITLANDPDVGV